MPVNSIIRYQLYNMEIKQTKYNGLNYLHLGAFLRKYNTIYNISLSIKHNPAHDMTKKKKYIVAMN